MQHVSSLVITTDDHANKAKALKNTSCRVHYARYIILYSVNCSKKDNVPYIILHYTVLYCTVLSYIIVYSLTEERKQMGE